MLSRLKELMNRSTGLCCSFDCTSLITTVYWASNTKASRRDHSCGCPVNDVLPVLGRTIFNSADFGAASFLQVIPINLWPWPLHIICLAKSPSLYHHIPFPLVSFCNVRGTLHEVMSLGHTPVDHDFLHPPGQQPVPASTVTWRWNSGEMYGAENLYATINTSRR